MKTSNVKRGLILTFVLGISLVGFSLSKINPQLSKPSTKINFLNVGQGDATLISTTGGHNILIDGGPDKSVLTELGKNLPPTVHGLDVLVLSHPHADHVAGLDYVLDRYQVGEIYLTGTVHNAPEYEDFLKKVKTLRIPAHRTYKGQVFSVDKVEFKCLYPENDMSGQQLKDQNEASNVFDVSTEGQHVLMMGDLPAKNQKSLIADGLMASDYEILKVSHHGSKTGTLSEIISHIQPKYSVISDGLDNSYGFPAATTLKQLVSTIILRTDQIGDVIFFIDSKGVHPG